MKKALILTAVIAMLSLAGTSEAATQLIVDPAAAQNGTNYGLIVRFDGSTSTAYVEDQSPADETIYRAIFFVDRTGGLTMDNCSGTCVTSHTMFLIRDDVDGTIDGNDQTVVRVTLRRLAVDNASGPRIAIRVGSRDNGGSFNYVGGVILAETQKFKQVMIEWQAGNGDGVTRLYARNTTADAWDLRAERTDLTNDNYVVDYVRLGATSAVDSTTLGDVYIDEFESYRTLSTP